MSVSKLESLPNEILILIFEKYLNAVDIFNSFADSQNKRFNGIINQCQRFSLNFSNCRKDHFYSCLRHLPEIYLEKIEDLILSEKNTPGQIYAFLLRFPSFIRFKKLRKIYLDLNTKSIDWSLITKSILSLHHTLIHTIFIKVTDTTKHSRLSYVINDIIGLKTLKRLIITSDIQHNQPLFLTNESVKIEYLTNDAISCCFQHLPYISQRASHLKYLNIQLTSESYYGYHQLINPITNNLVPIPKLQTLILSFGQYDPTTFDGLIEYLKYFPCLSRLEIKAHNVLLNANAWETFLQTSLPLLNNFILKTTTSRIKKHDIENILSSFETKFWIEKKNFYLIITEHQSFRLNKHNSNQIQINDHDEFNQPVIQWWIVPIRARIDDIPMKDITNLGISGVVNSLSSYYYFKNIKHLVIYNFDDKLLEWLLTYVNYSQIKYLDLSFYNHQSHSISLLLSYLKNLISLRIPYNRLLIYQHVYSGKDNYLKQLDISMNKHNFDKKDIEIISKLFPYLEHLIINTIDLSNIPLLKIFFPYLCSLTFKIFDDQFLLNHYRKQKILDEQLSRCLFQRNEEWITIWIDQVVLDDSYWQEFNSNAKRRLTSFE